MNRPVQDIKSLIRRQIKQIDPAAEIILYGSRARGDQRADSDWDLLVLTDYPVDLNKENEFRDHLYDLQIETGESFSIFVYYKKDWNTKQRISPFYHNLNKEGVWL